MFDMAIHEVSLVFNFEDPRRGRDRSNMIHTVYSTIFAILNLCCKIQRNKPNNSTRKNNIRPFTKRD